MATPTPATCARSRTPVALSPSRNARTTRAAPAPRNERSRRSAVGKGFRAAPVDSRTSAGRSSRTRMLPVVSNQPTPRRVQVPSRQWRQPGSSDDGRVLGGGQCADATDGGVHADRVQLPSGIDHDRPLLCGGCCELDHEICPSVAAPSPGRVVGAADRPRRGQQGQQLVLEPGHHGCSTIRPVPRHAEQPIPRNEPSGSGPAGRVSRGRAGRRGPRGRRGTPKNCAAAILVVSDHVG